MWLSAERGKGMKYNLEELNEAKCSFCSTCCGMKCIPMQGKRILFRAYSPYFFLEWEAEKTTICKEMTRNVVLLSKANQFGFVF